MPPRPPAPQAPASPATTTTPTADRPGRSADAWRTADSLGRDHPLTTLRPPSPRIVADAIRHDPTAAVWWLARADRVAAVSVVGAVTGRFVSVEAVFYRVSGITVWDALDALTARGQLSPRDAAIFPAEVLSAWGGGAAPEALPALYLPTPPHTGFRVLSHTATVWERSPTGIPGMVRGGHTGVRPRYVPDTAPLLCRLHTAAELRALVTAGEARYLPGNDPAWSLAVGGGAAGLGVDPVGRFYRPDAPDPADVRGSSLRGLDTPEGLDAVPAPWRAIFAKWVLPVAGSAFVGPVPGASTGHRMRRAVVFRVGALPASGPGGVVVFPEDVAAGDAPGPMVPADRHGWMVRVSRDNPGWGYPLGSWGLHSLAAFLDAHGIAPPPGTIPLGDGLAVWIGPRQTAAFLRSALAQSALVRARDVLRAHILDTRGPDGLAALRARFAPDAPWDGPDGTAPVGLDVPPPPPGPAAHTIPGYDTTAPPAVVLRVEAERGYEADRRGPQPDGGATPDGWYHPREDTALGQLIVAAQALGGEGPASAPATMLAAIVWPDRPASRLLRAQYAGLGLTTRHWRAAVSALLTWLDTGAEVAIPVGPTALWWAVQVAGYNVAHLGPTRSRLPGVEAILPSRNREALARYDATLARSDAPEALAMIRADRERAYAHRFGHAPGEGAVDTAGGWAEGLDVE